jgi:hypothetical protein
MRTTSGVPACKPAECAGMAAAAMAMEGQPRAAVVAARSQREMALQSKHAGNTIV